jgi:MFS family permease
MAAILPGIVQPRPSMAARRALIILSLSQIIAWGTLFYGMTMLGPRIRLETGWSTGLIYGGFALAMLTSGLAAPSVGSLIDRKGGRHVMGFSSVIGGSGYVILSLAHDPWVYLAGWGLIGFGMAGSLYDPAFATLARFAGPHSRRAISTLTLAGGLASTVFWPVGLWLLSFMDWRDVALVYALLNGIVCAALHRFGLPDDAERIVQAADVGQASNDNFETPVVMDRGLRHTTMICISIATMFHGLITNAMSVHLVSALDGMGLTETQAVAAGALIGPSQSLARLVEMLFGGRYPVMMLGLCQSRSVFCSRARLA